MAKSKARAARRARIASATRKGPKGPGSRHARADTRAGKGSPTRFKMKGGRKGGGGTP